MHARIQGEADRGENLQTLCSAAVWAVRTRARHRCPMARRRRQGLAAWVALGLAGCPGAMAETPKRPGAGGWTSEGEAPPADVSQGYVDRNDADWDDPGAADEGTSTMGLLNLQDDPVGESIESFVPDLPIFPLPPGTVFERHVVGGGVAASGSQNERLIYSNTRGRVAIGPTAFNLIADDLTVTTYGACQPTRIEFDVTGRVDPAGVGGAFEVEFGLYDTCPGAVPVSELPLRLITSGSAAFPNDLPRRVVFNVPADVVLPTSNVYLGMRFSRNNAGPIGGTPAQVGFTQDMFDFPGVACLANFGGFPDRPHGSFNIEIWGDAATCPVGHVEFLRRRESGPNTTSPPGNVWIVENISLLTANCELVAYEFVVTGQGTYQTEFRTDCGGGQIPGTFHEQLLTAINNRARTIRVNVDPPVGLNQDFWFAARVPQVTGGVVAPGVNPGIGSAGGFLALDLGNGTCQIPAPGIPQTGVSLAVICAGEAPTGACCDMYVPECIGGPDDGLSCDFWSRPCESPGICESVCREVPQINCTFPSRGQNLDPKWVDGATCENEPFARPCGQSACCKPNDTCENLTQNECDAVEPIDRPRQWQRGRFCREGAQSCPWNACLQRKDIPCNVAHASPGCVDPTCCRTICNLDAYCCLVEWDEVCVRLAVTECIVTSRNNECFRAYEAPASDRVYFSNAGASASDTDPPICCHDGTPNVCQSGAFAGLPCGSDGDCGEEIECGPSPPRAHATVWFKFTATHPVAELSMCNEDSTGDSLFQVFAVGDPSTNASACESLIPIGCADNNDSCGDSRHGRVCISGLVPGDMYYVMVGSKRPQDAGFMRLDIVSSHNCYDSPRWNEADCNSNGAPDGCDVANGTSADCNNNEIPDECEIADGSAFDCDGDGLLDTCEPEVASLTASQASSSYGYDVAIDGDTAFVSNPYRYPQSSEPGLGKVFVFQRHAETWSHAGTVNTPDNDQYDQFGASIALDDRWLWIGAPAATHAGVDGSGVAYVASRDRDNVGVANLIAPGVLHGRHGFGWAISAYVDRAVVSAITREGSPLAYVYSWTEGDEFWREEAGLIPESHPGNGVASNIDIWGDWAVAAPRYRDRIHVFRREGSLWLEQAELDLDLPFLLEVAVVIQGDLILALECRSPGLIFGYGLTPQVLHSFRRESREWIREPEVFGVATVGCGQTLDLHGDVAVGSGGQLFRRVNGAWISEGPLNLPLTGSAYLFPSALSVSGRRVVWRVPTDSYFGEIERSAYVLRIAPSDCNDNGRPDECDLNEGTSLDCNGNAIPDECENLMPFDSDFDGAADLRDFASMQNCFTGEKEFSGSSCCVLFDAAPPDGRVNAGDYSAFRKVLEGP